MMMLSRTFLILPIYLLSSVNAAVIDKVTPINNIATETPGSHMSEALGKVLEATIGKSKIQDELTKKLRIETTNITSTLNTLVDNLSSFLQKQIEAVGKLKEKMSDILLEDTKRKTKLMPCCELPDTEKSRKTLYPYKRFKQENTTMACEQKGKTSSKEDFELKKLIEEMKLNKERSDIGFQYYGNRAGVSTLYPAVKTTECTSFDPRMRPWYKQTASPRSRQIVILFDTSLSSRTRDVKDDMNTFAKHIIRSLNVIDFVSLIPMTNLSLNLNDCPNSSELSIPATKIHQQFLEGLINEFHPDGISDYVAAIKRAKQIFLNSTVTNKKLIILSKSTSKDKNEIIAALQELQGVQLLSYGFNAEGPRSKSSELQLEKFLKSLCDYIRDTNYLEGETIPGECRVINGSQDDTIQILSDDLSLGPPWDLSSDSRLSITLPYDCDSEIGVVLSVCLPVYYNARVDGVTCIDLELSRLREIAADLGLGEKSYVFLLNEHGHVLMHPLLPLPKSREMVTLHISELENIEIQTADEDTQEEARQKLFQDLLSNKSGTQTVYSYSVVNRGRAKTDGVDRISFPSTWHWKQIKDLRLTVCIVLARDDQTIIEKNIKTEEDSYGNTRLGSVDDLDMCYDSESSCLHVDCQPAVRTHSMVHLPPIAFTPKARKSKLWEGYNFCGFDKKEIVKKRFDSSINITEAAEAVWMSSSEELYTLQWRYVALENGVIRYYPGRKLPQVEFDHRRRHWYMRGLAQKHNMVLHGPYRDGWGTGFLVTLTARLEIADVSQSVTLGLIAGDFSIHNMRNLLKTTYPGCDKDSTSCIMMDTSTMIVMHDDFFSSNCAPNDTDDDDEPNITAVPLASKEKLIASDLIRRGIIEKRTCYQVASRELHHTWRILRAKEEIVLYKNQTGGLYDLHRLRFTNVFVIRKYRNDTNEDEKNLGVEAAKCVCKVNDYFASCGDQDVECHIPYGNQDKNANALCSSSTALEHWRNKNKYPLCAPDMEFGDGNTGPEDSCKENKKEKEYCFPPKECQKYEEKSSCEAQRYCYWPTCRDDESGFCQDSNFEAAPIQNNDESIIDEESDSSQSNEGGSPNVTIYIFLAAIAFLILLVFLRIGCIWFLHYSRTRANQ